MRAAARDLQAKGAALVLVKGGHLAGSNGRAAVDVACDGDAVEELEGEVVRCATRRQALWQPCKALFVASGVGSGLVAESGLVSGFDVSSGSLLQSCPAGSDAPQHGTSK